MADLVLPTTTKAAAGTKVETATAGEALVAGNAIYLDLTAGGVAKKCDGTTAAKANCAGVAVNSAPGTGQHVEYVGNGLLDTSGLTAGTPYFVAPATGGALAPILDVDTANAQATFVLIAKSATSALVRVAASGSTL